MQGWTGDSFCFMCLPGLKQSPFSQVGKLRLKGRWQSPQGREGFSLTSTAAWMEGWVEQKAGKGAGSCHHHQRHGHHLSLTECQAPDTPPTAFHGLMYLTLTTSPQGGIISSTLLIRWPEHREVRYPAQGHTDSGRECQGSGSSRLSDC